MTAIVSRWIVAPGRSAGGDAAVPPAEHAGHRGDEAGKAEPERAVRATL